MLLLMQSSSKYLAEIQSSELLILQKLSIVRIGWKRVNTSCCFVEHYGFVLVGFLVVSAFLARVAEASRSCTVREYGSLGSFEFEIWRVADALIPVSLFRGL